MLMDLPEFLIDLPYYSGIDGCQTQLSWGRSQTIWAFLHCGQSTH